MIKIGVPPEQVSFVKSIPHLSEFYGSKARFPADAYENLEWLANGFSMDEVLSMVAENAFSESDSLADALFSPGTLKSFVVVESDEELKRIMSSPLEKWRVFLHPTQRKIVEARYSGPARVLGGAGTGKTVVAMHRAKQLAGKVQGKGKILFTTFTANLAADIENNLKEMCTAQELRNIEVVNIDAWVSKFLRSNGYKARIIYDDDVEQLWNDALMRADSKEAYPPQFYQDEWAKVITPQDAFTRDAYFKATRVGRGIRLDRKKRAEVWRVFEEYLALTKARQLLDFDLALYECRRIVAATGTDACYQSIIVDEGQDLSINAYKLLRVLAGGEHENDFFIVGDSHQRIYKNRPVLSRCNINVRGRSSYLRINYRTTEEIRKYAFSLLKGITFDDLDEDYDDGRVCQSLTHGDLPTIKQFPSISEESAFVVEEIKKLSADGVDLRDICIVARTHKIINEYLSCLARNDIRVFEIKRSKLDDRHQEGIRVATMHRVKGLEFSVVLVVGVNKNIVPLASAIDNSDPIAREESLTAEKSLLYVALTRAQKKAYITYFGLGSDLLKE